MSLPRIALVGLGGYANFYISALLDAPERDFEFVAGIDPYAQNADHPVRKRLAQHDIPYVADLSEALEAHVADLYCLCTPIHLHAEQTAKILQSGASVLCEKPAASVVQDVDAMIAADQAATGFCAIGFQWSFSSAIQRLKQDILAGRWGAPRRLRSLIGWPRAASYYARNNWAGAQKDRQGNWVLDSPVANATAHFLHNSLYVLGETMTSSAIPDTLTAELYRANPIENFDAAAIHCTTAAGVDIHFYTAHCVDEWHDVEWIYEFEQGTIQYNGDPSHPESKQIIGETTQGERIVYGSPEKESAHKIWHCLDALSQEQPIACGPLAARAQVLCVNAAQESMPKIINLPNLEQKEHQGSVLTYDRHVLKDWMQCFERGCQPSDLGLDRVYRPGLPVDLRQYEAFPQKALP
jgi:predicted dehydrogenase